MSENQLHVLTQHCPRGQHQQYSARRRLPNRVVHCAGATPTLVHWPLVLSWPKRLNDGFGWNVVKNCVFNVEIDELPLEYWALVAWSPTAGVYTFKACFIECALVDHGGEDYCQIMETYGTTPDLPAEFSVIKFARRPEPIHFARDMIDPSTKQAFAEPFCSNSSLPMLAHATEDELVATCLTRRSDPPVQNVCLTAIVACRIGFNVFAFGGGVDPVIEPCQEKPHRRATAQHRNGGNFGIAQRTC